MARPLRITFEGAWYHVMNRGINHNKIFFFDENKEKFLCFLQEIIEIYGVEAHAFCLMDNHYHLIIHTPRGNISQAIRYLNSKFAQYVNIYLNRDGPLFKGRFKAILINADEYLLRLSRYIHRNPFEAGMIKNLENYKWSSYLDYLNKRKPSQWLSTQEIIQRFGEKDFKQQYKLFVECDQDAELQDFYKKQNNQIVLGSEDFCQKIFDDIKAHSLSAEIVGANHILIPPSVEKIIESVSNYFNIPEKNILEGMPKLKNFPRNIAIFICRKIGGYSLPEIAGIMNISSIKTIASVVKRTSLNQTLKKDIDIIVSLLNKTAKTIK